MEVPLCSPPAGMTVLSRTGTVLSCPSCVHHEVCSVALAALWNSPWSGRCWPCGAWGFLLSYYSSSSSPSVPVPLQYTWWKTKEGMTWVHPPASQPAGRPSVAAVSGTCSPDQPGSPVLPALPPLRTRVPAPPLLIAEIND